MNQPAQRQTVFKVGPHFDHGHEGEDTFMFVVDGSSIIGPRPATDADRVAHPAAYSEHLARADAKAAAAAEASALAIAHEELQALRDAHGRLQAEFATREALITEHLGTIMHLENRIEEEAYRADAASADLSKVSLDRAELQVQVAKIEAELEDARKAAKARSAGKP